MALTRVKICGITRREDAELAVELGAAAVGFVFWTGSPRFVNPDHARAIARALPAFVTRVGIFVDETAETVHETADRVGLGAVQLHGSETPAFCAGMRRPVIRGVGLEDGAPIEGLLAWPSDVTLLLDAHDPRLHGGTGRRVNWTLAAKVARARPTILSGGLRAENVTEAIAAVRPWAVDVSSGVEAKPGIKDPARMRALFHAVELTGRTA